MNERRRTHRAIPTTTPATDPAERDRAILEDRARVLARRPDPPEAAGAIEVLVVRMGEERHALETRFVRQVARPAACTPIPGCPGSLVGLVNLGGEVLAVFDPGLALGLGPSERGPWSRVVVLGDGRGLLLGATAGGMGVLDGAALLADDRFFIG